MDGMIFDIAHGSFVDGPGIRTTVFFKGCNLRCVWCHNPESQAAAREKLNFTDKCIHCGKCREVCPSPAECTLCGRCADVCPRSAIQLYGEVRSAESVFSEILKDRLFYIDGDCAGGHPDPLKNGGVTFSGGECLLQPDFLKELLILCNNAGICTAVDTAGHVPEAVLSDILTCADLFLYDLKVMDPTLHRKYTGVSNERILANYRYLKNAGARIIVRVPVIPGVNDTKDNMTALRAFFETAGWPERIELLPYHRLGENKWRAKGIDPASFDVPDQERIKELYDILK